MKTSFDFGTSISSLFDVQVELTEIALVERLGEDERLDRRAGLALALGGEVERQLVVVVAADHRAHGAGAVLDRHERGARAFGVRQPGVDRLLRGVLDLAVDRGADLQAAVEREAGALLAAAEAVDHLLLDPRREVGVLGVLDRRLEVAAVRQRLGERGVVARAREEALLEHPQQHEIAALLAALRVGDRVVRARGGDHAGQQRRLVRLELGGAVAALDLVAAGMVGLEVRARGGLDAVGAVAEVDRVQVVAEDPLLRPLARQVVGHRRLAQLLEDRAVVLGGERVLDELLRDRRAALDGLLRAHVLPQRAADAAHVDALVRVEAAVLDRDDRVLHHGRDLLLAEEDALLVAGQDADAAAAAVEDHRRAVGRLLERRQVGRDGHHHPEDGRDGREAGRGRSAARRAGACGCAPAGAAAQAARCARAGAAARRYRRWKHRRWACRKQVGWCARACSSSGWGPATSFTPDGPPAASSGGGSARADQARKRPRV